MITPYDGSVEAQYEDGYTHSETELGDVSPYGPFYRELEDGIIEQFDHNILNDIIEKRPEAEHGKLVRFSLFYKDQRHDVDWSDLPENARPIRFKHWEQDLTIDGPGETRLMSVDFGYQYTDENGKNVKEVQEIL